MKVSNLIQLLMKLPYDHDILIAHRTQYGDVILDLDHVEVKREYELKETEHEISCLADVCNKHLKTVEVEETSERCIMVLS